MQIIVERCELEVTVFLTNAAIYLVFFVIDYPILYITTINLS